LLLLDLNISLSFASFFLLGHLSVDIELHHVLSLFLLELAKLLSWGFLYNLVSWLLLPLERVLSGRLPHKFLVRFLALLTIQHTLDLLIERIHLLNVEVLVVLIELAVVVFYRCRVERH